MRTTRGTKKTPLTGSKSQKGKNKRLHDEDDDTNHSPVQVDSGDEILNVQQLGNREGSSLKNSKYGIVFVSDDLETCFK